MPAYIVLDFETYYDKEYSLRRMTPVEYILDCRFECMGAAVAEGDDGPAFWLDDPELRTYLKGKHQARTQGEKLVVVSHNALFDMCLLAWRFGLVPDLMIDTMGMARGMGLATKTGSVSLENVAAYLGVGAKGKTILKVQGMGAAAIKAAGLWGDYTSYATNDAVLCREILKQLRVGYPAEEYLVQDMVLRCAITPRFKLDATLLHEYAHEIRERKSGLLDRCGISKPELMSNDKFAEALRRLGIEPPTKTSLTTGEPIYAFAKADQAMADLEEHDDPDVQALVAARLGFKSTIEETRAQRFINISNLTWPGKLGSGWMPIPLRYSGAHTHRLSGDWKLNLQNMPRGGKLRKALVAPPGYTVVTCDAAQIEARIVAWLAGCEVLVKAFADKEDIYSLFAGKHIYRREVSKKTPKERFVGKQAVLGLGFGMGPPRYQTQVRKDSRLQLKEEIILTTDEAERIVFAYRREYREIPETWKFLQQEALPAIAHGVRGLTLGPVAFEPQAVLLPNGMRLYYPDLRQELTSRGNEWVFKQGKKNSRLFGGKLYENIVQALARIINMHGALIMRRRFPQFPLALQAHDELVYVVPTPAVAEVKAALEEIMSTPPGWAAGLPLAAESGSGASYGDAK